MVPGGAIYREQGVILSPFDNDETRHFFAHRMFMGAQGVGRLGVMERDPLLIQAERKLIDQAEALVVLVDSSKFNQRSSLILCALDRVDTIVTDDGVDADVAAMLDRAGVKLIVAEAARAERLLKVPETA
jgi:DeoR family ulaG and ulaABCDEF operon transcriptional repressor